MPFGSRRQQHRARGQPGDESAIEISTDELPEPAAENLDQGGEMEYEQQGGDEDEDEEEPEGESTCPCILPPFANMRVTNDS